MIKSTVCIVGAGLAGLSTAVELDCTIVEKSKGFGGNSRDEMGGISAVPTSFSYQSDGEALFFTDMIKSGKGKCHQEVLRAMISRSCGAINFLQDNGVELCDISRSGGHTYPRVHMSRIGINFGEYTISSLERSLDSSVNTIFDSEVIDMDRNSSGEFELSLINSNSESSTLLCEYLVVASGGFTSEISDELFRAKETPNIPRDLINLDDLPTTNYSRTSGELMWLVNQNFSGNLVGMGEIQVMPTGIISKNDPSEEIVKHVNSDFMMTCGAILLNSKGSRFVDESSNQSVISKEIFQLGEIFPDTNRTFCRMIMNEESLVKYGYDDFENLYLNDDDLVSIYDDSNTFCEQEGLEYSDFIQNSPFSSEEKLYLMYITPALHSTLGGLEIDDCARVVSRKKDEDVVPKLYAAGECTGGIHGANMLDGNGFLDCVVFGRTAAHDIIFEKIVNIHEEFKKENK